MGLAWGSESSVVGLLQGVRDWTIFIIEIPARCTIGIQMPLVVSLLQRIGNGSILVKDPLLTILLKCAFVVGLLQRIRNGTEVVLIVIKPV